MRRFTDINHRRTCARAISAGRLRLNAQLIVPLRRGTTGGPHFEILLRMIDENGEIAGPDISCRRRMRYQLMPTLDRWVIERAIEMLKPHAELLPASRSYSRSTSPASRCNDESFSEFLLERIALERPAGRPLVLRAHRERRHRQRQAREPS